ncbi:MAG: CopG family antitoxin [Candidatus Binatia bacterium]
MIDPTKPLTLTQLGIDLPKVPPTQVVSIRLPSELLNQPKAFASARDIPYQALIKLLPAESLAERRAGSDANSSVPTPLQDAAPSMTYVRLFAAGRHASLGRGAYSSCSSAFA